MGQTATQNFLVCGTIDVLDDNAVEENDESLTLSLSPHNPFVTLITAPFATVIIKEDDNDGIANYKILASVGMHGDRTPKPCTIKQGFIQWG